MLEGMDPNNGGNKEMIVRITRDIFVDDNLILGEGALRVISEDNFDVNDPSSSAKLFVPANVTEEHTLFVALEVGDYEVLPVLGGTVG